MLFDTVMARPFLEGIAAFWAVVVVTVATVRSRRRRATLAGLVFVAREVFIVAFELFVVVGGAR